jgi:endonuclease/exonuclease/phosphatase family metal-dependent hydrolase
MGNERIHEASNDNEIRVVNFATSKNLIVKSTFPQRDIHKRTWTSPDGVTHNQIDHVLIDKRQHSNILDVRSFRGADCDTDHYLVVAKLRERISVSKRARKIFYLERFDLKNFHGVEVKENYQVEISNRFTALESLDESFDINSAWESIRENIKTSAKDILGYQKLKHNKPWLDEECSKLIDQQKQAKLQ